MLQAAIVNAEAQKQIELQQRFQQEHLKRQQEHIMHQQHKIQELQVSKPTWVIYAKKQYTH